MPEVQRQKCPKCGSVFIVKHDDVCEMCPRCERDLLSAKARQQAADLKKLEEFALMLTHGIPDRCGRLVILIEKNDAAGVRDHLASYVASLAKDILSGQYTLPLRDIEEEIDHLQDNFDYGDIRGHLREAFENGMKFKQAQFTAYIIPPSHTPTKIESVEPMSMPAPVEAIFESDLKELDDPSSTER